MFLNRSYSGVLGGVARSKNRGFGTSKIERKQTSPIDSRKKELIRRTDFSWNFNNSQRVRGLHCSEGCEGQLRRS